MSHHPLDPVHLLRIRTPPPDPEEDGGASDVEQGRAGGLPPPYLPHVQAWNSIKERELRSNTELYIGASMATAGFFIGGVLGSQPYMLLCSATMGLLACLLRQQIR